MQPSLLSSEGIDVEVVDLRSLVPVDSKTVMDSVARTRRAVVAHESWLFGGYGSELASQISDELFDTLEAPVARVGAKSAPIPFSPPLEKAVVPGSESIADAVKSLVDR